MSKNVLIACEESQRVCLEFRRLGFNAYSCDILPCSGGHPEYHFQNDIKMIADSSYWDLIIAFPPCTHLCNAGQRWFTEGRKDYILQDQAIDFFMYFTRLKCDHVAIENPVGIMSSWYRKPDQIINPWQFGDTDKKRTCLWLKGLPLLEPTNIIPIDQRTDNNHKAIFNGKQLAWNDPLTAYYRSKTYPGIAKAMAEQWSVVL